MKKKKGKKIMLILFIGFLIYGISTFAYLYFNGMTMMIQRSDPKPGQIKVACVGDSITFGHGVSNWPKNNYPKLLSNKLGEEYHVQSFGISGRAVQDTSDQPYTALKYYTESVAYDADILVFMMGTNDSKPENWIDEETFKKALTDLLDSYMTGENSPKVFLCTPAASFFTDGKTSGVTSHDIQPEVIPIIADIVREVAQEQGYALIDIFELTLANPQWFAKDGVHPNNDGAAAIAQAVYQAINEK